MIAPTWRAARAFPQATALLALAVSATTALAQTNLLQNGGFESSYFNDSHSTSQGIGFVGAVPNFSSGYATVPSWTVTPGAYSPSTFALNKTGGNLGVTAEEGTYSVSFGTGSAQSGGSIAQSFSATSGAHCTLSFWVRRIGGGQGIGARVQVTDNNNSGAQVTLTDTANATYTSGYTVPIPGTSNVWSQVTLKFTAPSSSLSFQFTDTTPLNGADSTDLGLDNISITQKTLQTITFYGGVGNQGDVAANTEYSNDGDVSWHPAYLSGAHPWGFLPGTSSWINQSSSPFVGLYQTTDFRIKFNLPAEFEDGSMSFQVNADNHGELFINTTSLSSTDGGFTPSLITADGSSLLPGQVNILKIRLTDYGGWVGINYVLTLTGYAYSAPTVVVLAPVITNTLNATGTVGVPFSFQLTGGNSPASFGAGSLPPGLLINSATGIISGTPTTYGTYNTTISETNSGGTTTGTLTITINRGSASVTLGGLSQVYDGTVKSATATTNPGNLTVSFSYTGAALPPINAGIYGVLGAVSDSNYSGSASGNMTISAAPLTITFGNLTQTYTGSALGASVSTSPGNIATTVTYNGNASLPVNVGNYTVAAASANSNYSGTRSGTLTIVPAALGISFGNLAQTYNGSAHPVTVTTSPSGIATTAVTYAGSTTAPTNAGNYTVATSSANANYTGSATATLTIAPQATTITIGNTVQAFDGTPKSVTTATSPTANVPVTVTYNGSPTAPTAVGNYTVSATTDSSNYAGSATATLQITDTTAPVINGSGDVTVEATSALGAVATFSATATDNVDGTDAVTFSPTSGTLFPLGATTVTETAHDAAGNPASANFTVNVVDTTAPVLSLPADISAEATGPTGAAVSFAPTATDAVGVRVVHSDFESPVVATNSATYESFGNTATVGAWTFHGYGGYMNGNGGGGFGPYASAQGVQHAFIQAYYAPSSMESANTFSVVAGQTYVVSFDQGERINYGSGVQIYTVTLNGPNGSIEMFRRTTAASEQWAHYTASVTPTVSGTYTLSFNNLGNGGGDTTIYIDDVKLYSTAVPVVTTPASGSTFQIGTTTVNATATDDAGNTGSGSFHVTVTDTTAPAIAAHADIVAEATSASGAAVTFTTSATDLVDGAVDVVASPASGSTFPLGTSTVALTATDAHGNTSTSSFKVTVQDTTAPTLTVPANQVIEATGASGAVATFEASATDAVTASPEIGYSAASGSTFAIGVNTVTVTAKDAAGNTATGTFTITVQDTTAPAITAPAPITAEATSANGAAVSFSASANDIVDGAVATTASPSSGSTFAIGTTTVTVTATDAHGNTATKAFTVTVQDTTAPTITAPAPIVAEATSAAGAAVAFTASASDLVDGSVAVTAAPASGSTFALGTTAVTLTSTDAHHNTATKTFTVSVVDTTAPALTVPANQVLEATSAAGAVATYSASATDAVTASPAIAYSIAPGSTFALGTTTVSVTATDAAGNVAKGSFTITVRDTTAPALTVPQNLTLEATSVAGAVANFAASATDIVTASPAIAYSIAPGSTFEIGTTTVAVTATDAAGNQSTGSFTVTVRDTTAPTISSVSASPNTLWPPNKKMVPVTISVGSTDLVGVSSVKIVSVTTNEPDSTTQWQITGNLTLTLKADRLGTGSGRIYTITVEARDAAGNTTRQAVTVTVPHDQGK